MDGGVARLAGPRRDAERARHHVHDPSGVLRLRDARNIFVGSGFGRRTLPPARRPQRHLIPAGSARVLPDRLHIGDTALVDGGGYSLVRFFRGGAALAQPGRARAWQIGLSLDPRRSLTTRSNGRGRYHVADWFEARIRKSFWGALTVEFYIALVLALSLAAIAGVLYFYLMFLEARSRQQGRRVVELERANAALLEELRSARATLAGKTEDGHESWPEVIDEDSGCSMN
jgi:hypothetical protein